MGEFKGKSTGRGSDKTEEFRSKQKDLIEATDKTSMAISTAADFRILSPILPVPSDSMDLIISVIVLTQKQTSDGRSLAVDSRPNLLRLHLFTDEIQDPFCQIRFGTICA